ncbi:piggyBac transposable element-derived protein 3-like [Schistocerca americana]|uniref:piggyBac transposable element-derived protein 3-like n=1 Tax=Schistocerca americana TaxID=7009 RepID=UPI001F4FCAD9|nr:piggyBac transposable element-derived protein 3-like [Schistocerca americana]
MLPISKYYSSRLTFIRGKPIRFGYKLWSLCGASGYCFKFYLYCGKDPEDTARDDLLLGSRFFTRRDLMILLRILGFRITGTVRENRVGDCPLLSSNELKKTVRGNYDYHFDRNGEVLFLRWHDNTCVQLIQIFTEFNFREQLRGTVDKQVRRHK